MSINSQLILDIFKSTLAVKSKEQNYSEYFQDNIKNVSSGSEMLVEAIRKQFILKNGAVDKHDFIVYSDDHAFSSQIDDNGCRVNHQSLARFSDKVVYAIRNSSFEEGNLSPADFIVEEALETYGEHFAHKLLNNVWQVFYSDVNQDYHAHFLNVIKNISYKIDYNLFRPIAISAYAHSDVLIREYGISLFEGWDDPSDRYILENTADSGIPWLDQYKREVIENLGA